MSERTDSELLSDIREALDRITNYVAGMSYEGFLSDKKTQDAVIRNLEILGEAAKKISGQVRSAYPAIPWKSMAGARDRLIHHYFGVNLDIVWNIVATELPQVALQIKELTEKVD